MINFIRRIAAKVEILDDGPNYTMSLLWIMCLAVSLTMPLAYLFSGKITELPSNPLTWLFFAAWGINIIMFTLTLTDALIYRLVEFATDGDIRIKSYLSRKLWDDTVNYSTSGYIAVTIIAIAVWFLIVAVLYVPFLTALVGVGAGLLLLIRMMYRINKRFKSHVSDPNAHAKSTHS